MQSDFARGQRIVAIIVATILLINVVNIWFTQTWLLRWYLDWMAAIPSSWSLQLTRLLQLWFTVNYDLVLADRIPNFALILLLCGMLYLGFNWLRWLWAIHWIMRGALGAFSGITVYNVHPSNFLIGVGLLISMLYLICGITMLYSPSVRYYMHSMRRLTTR